MEHPHDRSDHGSPEHSDAPAQPAGVTGPAGSAGPSSRAGAETVTGAEPSARRAVRSRMRWAVTSLGVVALALWWFQPQTLLFDRVVDEEFPVGVAEQAQETDRPPDDTAEADGAAEADGPVDTDADRAEDAEVSSDGAADPGGAENADETTSDAGDDEAAAAGTGPIALGTGQFESRNRYTVTGTATTFALEDGGRVLRLEDFESTNGPDLFVYLTVADAADDDAALDADVVDLGELRGNVGNQNYVIGDDVDLDRYDTVVIWCRRFSTSFGVADLAAVG